jgi:hypothetical protein
VTNESMLLALADYWQRNRQVGHTTAMVAGAGNVDPVIVVCANEHNKMALEAVLDKSSATSKPRMMALGELDRIRGLTAPLVVDHHALVALIGGVHEEMGRLRAALASEREANARRLEVSA